MSKAKITIKPVAWHGDKVTMYQGFATWKADESRTIQIVGDPAITEREALRRLKMEHALWEKCVRAVKEELAQPTSPTKEAS